MFAVVPLRDHIDGVVRRCAREEVFWPYARAVVAVMAHVQAGWDWAHSQFVGKSMSQYVAAFRADKEVAIPLSGLGTNPYPAFAGLIDLRPEPFINGLALAIGICTRRATITHLMRPTGRRSRVILRTAMRTSTHCPGSCRDVKACKRTVYPWSAGLSDEGGAAGLALMGFRHGWSVPHV